MLLRMSTMSPVPNVARGTFLGQRPVLLSSAVVADRQVGPA
jgi:hypothetical protein